MKDHYTAPAGSAPEVVCHLGGMATLGKDHPEVANTRGTMGQAYIQQSKSAEALRELQEALRIELATLGKDHPNVASTRGIMGQVYIQ